MTELVREFSMVWKIWTYQETQPSAVELTVLLVTGNAAAIQIFFSLQAPPRLINSQLIFTYSHLQLCILIFMILVATEVLILNLS